MITRIINLFYNIYNFTILNLKFFKDKREFTKSISDSRFGTNVMSIKKCLYDNTKQTYFDSHYIYHPAWAARKLKEINPQKHYDFSSILYFSTLVSAFLPIKFFDYRPAQLNLSNLESDKIDLTKINLPDAEFESISCMHTIEHIGLGRYGDKINPKGDLEAIYELKRITKIGGYFILVVPVGKPQIVYNAHRIYSFDLINDNFQDFELIEFSMIDDNGIFIEHANIRSVLDQNYACGCFLYKKIKHE